MDKWKYVGLVTVTLKGIMYTMTRKIRFVIFTTIIISIIAFALITSGKLRSLMNSDLITPTLRNTLIPVTKTQITSVLTLAPSLTVEGTPTETMLPGYPAPAAYELMSRLLKDNGGCKLPCFWGITPGKSLPQELKNVLSPFTGIATSNYLDSTSGSLYLVYPKDHVEIKINIYYSADDLSKPLKVIKVSTESVVLQNGARIRDFNAREYIELLNKFSAKNIISEYGIPSDTLIRADIIEQDYTPSPANDVSKETFSITWLYPDQGIFIRYTSLGERSGNEISGCLDKSFFELWLLSPDNSLSYQEILSAYDETWEGNWSYSKTIEEAMQISKDEFYEILGNSKFGCISTPLNIWPGQR